jgi:hypothetical protein
VKEIARKLGIAVLAVFAGALGNAVGQVACDTIKETFARPVPTPRRRRVKQ